MIQGSTLNDIMTLSNLWFSSRWLNGLCDHAHVGQNIFSKVSYWQICSFMIVDMVQLNDIIKFDVEKYLDI